MDQWRNKKRTPIDRETKRECGGIEKRFFYANENRTASVLVLLFPVGQVKCLRIATRPKGNHLTQSESNSPIKSEEKKEGEGHEFFSFFLHRFSYRLLRGYFSSFLSERIISVLVEEENEPLIYWNRNKNFDFVSMTSRTVRSMKSSGRIKRLNWEFCH